MRDDNVRHVVGIDLETAYELMRQLIDGIERSKSDIPVVPKWSITELKGHSVIRLHGKAVVFTGKRKAIMECLVRSGGEPVDYGTLHAAGWGDSFYDPDVIKKAIGNLKRDLQKINAESTVKISEETAQLVDYVGD